MASRTGFCSYLREKTKQIHDDSDRLINIKLAATLTDKTLWAEAIADFYFVFQTLESSINAQKDHPNVGPLYFDELQRTTAFQKDLKFYIGPKWEAEIKPSAAARRYCDRILQVTEEDPALLIACV